MLFLGLLTIATIFGSSCGQVIDDIPHLHGAICHSNRISLTEDQVINILASEVDNNHDKIVTTEEIVSFFVGLVGIDLGSIAAILGTVSTEELLHAADGLCVTKAIFVHNWHERFHDSYEFVAGTFDRFDLDKDECMGAHEMENIVNRALSHADTNNDKQLEKDEFIHFLEAIYKHCD